MSLLIVRTSYFRVFLSLNFKMSHARQSNFGKVLVSSHNQPTEFWNDLFVSRISI